MSAAVAQVFLTALAFVISAARPNSHEAAPTPSRDESVHRPAPQSSALFDVALNPPAILGATGSNHIFVAGGVVGPDTEDTRTFILPKLDRIEALLIGKGVRWSFRSPGGEVIVPGDADTRPGYKYGRTNEGLAAFTLESPAKGKWTVAISSALDTAVTYGIDIAASGPAEEKGHFELMLPGADPSVQIVARPGDVVYVRTFVSNGGELVVGTRWDVRGRTPGDSLIVVPVFDDGKHADGKAGDGVFVGALIADELHGIYQLRAEGQTPSGNTYGVVGVIEVQAKNDLLIRDSIEVSPKHPKAGEPVTLTVTVMNDGTGELKDVALELFVDRAKESEQRVDLKPGESRRVRTTWVPPVAASYVVQLTLAPWHEPYWSDFTNNTKRTTVRVH